MLSAAVHTASSQIWGALILVCGLGLLLWLFSYISAKSKWNEYAVRYRCPNQPADKAWPVRWASFGKRGNQCKYSYEKCVRVLFTEPGVYLSMGRIMGYFYKPFLMPWSKVKFIEHYDGPFYRKYMVTIWEGADEIYLEMLDQGQGDLLKQFYKKSIAAGDPRMELDPQFRPY